ncbi:carbohydrate esterase family 5 protein [Diaporthe amygdali]|uniref:carbohydrate esterase family 5 protein n=1 Tax=Phomopsis amygdali TaxID=1214568 RepID=UPI0022FECAB0|nr:carbohydrate esterase family 5 protein [Diaporthe amygdali]KAJ0106950.1 carbohydrate esterase family 5 protein [Diaporthe amygdali]
MHFFRATLALGVIIPASAEPLPLSTRQELNTTCAPIHYIVARGTTEGYPGSLGSLVDILLAKFPDSNYEDVIYPATQETSTNSYWEGLANATQQIKTYADTCTDSKIAVLGYSQGALVVGDLFAGGGNNSELGNATTPPYIDFATYGQRVNAILLYGDPRHMPNQSFNQGNVSALAAPGKYPRSDAQLAAINLYAEKLHDYCNYEDGVCDTRGVGNLTAHMAYTSDYNTVASEWLETMLTA